MRTSDWLLLLVSMPYCLGYAAYRLYRFLQRARLQKDAPLRKVPVTVAVIAALLITLLAPLTVVDKAQAWQGNLPQCSTGLSLWDWPAAVKEQIPAFNKDTSTYMIGQGSAQTGSTGFSMYYATPPHTLSIYKDATSGNYALKSDTYLTIYSITDMTTGQNAGTVGTGTGLSVTTTNTTAANGGFTCVFLARNVSYESTYDGNRFNNTTYYKSGVSNTTCTATDFGCWMGRIGSGISGTLAQVSEEILKGFTFLFAPDSGKTQASFDALQSQLSANFGFLTFPFSFMADFFGAFNSNAGGCTSTVCNRSFGSFQGQPFQLNISQLGVTMPALWTWLLAAIRGLTILGLIFAIRSKYIEVMQK